MKKCIKITFILLILFFSYILLNKCYAISTKEDVEDFIKYSNENLKDNLNKFGMKYGKWYIGNMYSYTDNETGKTHTYLSTSAAYSKDNSFILDNIVENTFKEYFNKYLDESLADDERLISYIVSSSIYTRKENYQDGDDIEAEVGAYVFPASEDTIWAKDKKLTEIKYYSGGKEKTLQGYFIDSYYVRLVKEDDDYVIKFIDTLPEGYADFVQRVKDTTGLDLENINYADFINAKSKTEIIAESAEKSNLESANIDNQEITEEKISILVASVCVILIVFIMLSYSSYLRKRRK